MSTSKSWFEASKDGLASILERRGKAFAPLEMIQNAIDAGDVTTVAIILEAIAGRRGLAQFEVLDDSPEGWKDLTHAYTVFARSEKVSDPEKRGRFNLGEKLVLAICDEATITSTKGGVRFDAEGRHTLRTKRESGSLFAATIRMTRPEIDEAILAIESVIVPKDVRITLNGAEIPFREPLHTFEATLATENADEDGNLRPTRRKTTVSVYEPRPDETASIYEMGIPVVDNGDRWSYSVGQKVPLSLSRDSVPPAYLRHLRTLVLNEMHQKITDEEATGTWVKEALADPRVEPEAVLDVVHKLYGEDAVIFDPNDPEANRMAAAQGRTVIPPRAFSKDAWTNIRNTGGVLPAGRVTPSPKVSSDPEAQGIDPLTDEQLSAGMLNVMEYAKRFTKAVIGVDARVDIFPQIPGENLRGRIAATYGNGHLSFSLQALGRKFFDNPDQVRLDALIIHELGHHYSNNHLSEDYYDGLCKLGANAKAKAAEIGTVN